jgi:PiT family inorganic phosphate transporter
VSLLYLLSGSFLGWGLGANDSANIYGTAVYTKVVSYRLAVILTAVFVIIGAVIDGEKGIENVSSFALVNGITLPYVSFLVMLAAAITVMAMTMLKLPVSTSQAVIGAILGHGFLVSKGDLQVASQFFLAWILTPIGGMLFSLILYWITVKWLEEKLTSFKYFEGFIKWGYIIAGAFAAYSLGANNVANVFGVFLVDPSYIKLNIATLLGGFSIALGVITYSRPVMMTVGKGIVPLTNVTGFLVIIASAITVYIYAKIGIPVSTSQAVVGAIIGIGLMNDYRLINLSMLSRIFIGWILTPTIAGIVSILFLKIFI